MPQTGAASPPASRRHKAPRLPVALPNLDLGPAPNGSQHSNRLDSRGAPVGRRNEMANYSGDEERAPPADTAPRTSMGMQSILNHPIAPRQDQGGDEMEVEEERPQQQSQPPRHMQPQHEPTALVGSGARLSLSDTDMSPGGAQLGSAHYGHQPYATARQFPFPRVGSLPSPVGSGSAAVAGQDGPSPTLAAYGLPPLSTSRRILSPRTGRPPSLSQASPNTMESPHQFGPSPTTHKRSFPGSDAPRGSDGPHNSPLAQFASSSMAQKRPFSGSDTGVADGALPPPPPPLPLLPPIPGNPTHTGSLQRSLSQSSAVPRLMGQVLSQRQAPQVTNNHNHGPLPLQGPSRPPSRQGGAPPPPQQQQQQQQHQQQHQGRPVPTTAFPAQQFPNTAQSLSTLRSPYPSPGGMIDARSWGPGGHPGFSPGPSPGPSPEPPTPLGGGGLGRRTGVRPHSFHAPVEGDLFWVSPAGEQIHVPIDRQKASIEASIKRERNAGASARFRQRKKERDRELMERAQVLEEEKHKHQVQIQELASMVEFYRNERNRLRDVVVATPGIQDQAAGPPSPVLSPRRTGPSGGHAPIEEGHQQQAQSQRQQRQQPRRPQPQHPQHHQQQQHYHHRHRLPSQQDYGASDESSSERPTRRRRTDSAPSFSPVSYGNRPALSLGSAQPPRLTTAVGSVSAPGISPTHALPPMQVGAHPMSQMHGHSHGHGPGPGPLQPPSPSIPGTERLPPFRINPQPPASGSHGQAFTPTSKVTPELGWATTRTTGPPPS